ncbi:MAG TPA: FAD-dependent oxidoreductase [Tepidisphaeraceae bacterium]|nr:FAD-dependent oxidoreductase [Tepidisphaeraceae bacterium]
MGNLAVDGFEVPLDDGWDVIVVGGGPAGCTAAAAAARDGARTLLVESGGNLGGSGTTALVPAWCPFTDLEKVIYRGLAARVLHEAKKDLAHVPPEREDWVPIDAERLKVVYDDLVTGAGAAVLFHTVVARVQTDGNGTVTHLLAANKAGLTALSAKVVVDCSGDADVCAWAGATFHKGAPHDERRLMPATHCFVLSNVDSYAYANGPHLHAGDRRSPIHAIVASGQFPQIPDVHCCSNLVGPSTVGFNAGHIWNVDNTDPWSVSRGLVQGRKMARAFRDALAKFYPEAFANAHLVQTGAQIGIRETRRVVGDYVLTLDDYVARRTFDDEVCRNSYFIDVHWAADEIANDVERFEKWDKACLRYGKGESHGIPYRCLVPRDLKNVLVAGRGISCEQVVQGSVRVMPVCLAMGEAAGTAAAMAAGGHDGSVRAVDTTRLRSRLREEGAYLP